jgi:uncharacterized repeat protein (TIGR01451 family)
MLSRILSSVLMVTVLSFMAASAMAQSCDSSVDGYLLDWSAQSWTSGAASGTFSAPKTSDATKTSSVSVAFSGSTNRLLSGYPEVNNKFTGGYSSSDRSLSYAVDFSANTQNVVLTITFDKAVENLKFEMFDVDSLAASNGTGGFRDGLKLSGQGPSGTVLPTLTKRPSNSTIWLGSPLESNWALGYYGQSDDTSANGNLYVSFASPVQSVTIIYTNDIHPPSTNPSPQGVALYDLSFCIATPMADIAATKSQAIHSHTPINCDIIPGTREAGAEFALPGACVEYVITATNKGQTSADQVTLTDVLASQLIFRAATHSGFTSGGAGFGLSAPPAMQDCSGSRCTISLANGILSPGQTGTITIRATIK